MNEIVTRINLFVNKWILVLVGAILILRACPALMTLYMKTSPLYPGFMEGDPITKYLFETIGDYNTTMLVIMMCGGLLILLTYISTRVDEPYIKLSTVPVYGTLVVIGFCDVLSNIAALNHSFDPVSYAILYQVVVFNGTLLNAMGIIIGGL